ncbi:S-layer homology domain-containing protein [Paenibacillus validus]|uniref:S-layer homology domain-containing protein n=2 Tax=Paenibacillus validus TaxID=44253 RepID=UPI003D274A3B
MRKTIVTSSIALSLLFGSSVASAEPTFTDLNSTHWAYKSVAGLAAKNVISGYQDGSYKPDSTITRAELAVILTKVTGLEAKAINKTSYSDVKPTDWFAPYVEAVRNYMGAYVSKETGVVVYAPDRATTREEIASAIVMAKGFKPKDVKVLDSYHDTRDIAASRLNHLAAAVENGIISGYDDQSIRPKSSVTRAEAAVIIWRAFGGDIASLPISDQSLGYWTNEKAPEYFYLQKAGEHVSLAVCHPDVEIERIPFSIKSENSNELLLQAIEEPNTDENKARIRTQDGKLIFTTSKGSYTYSKSSKADFYACAGADITKKHHEMTIGGITIGDSEDFLLKTFNEQLKVLPQNDFTVYKGTDVVFNVYNGKVVAIHLNGGTYKLINGIGRGNKLAFVMDTYENGPLQLWEDSKIVSTVTDDGIIIGFELASIGDIFLDDKVAQILIMDKEFFKVSWSEDYDEKMKSSTELIKSNLNYFNEG